MGETSNIIYAMPNEEGSPEECFNWAALIGILIGLGLGWWAAKSFGTV